MYTTAHIIQQHITVVAHSVCGSLQWATCMRSTTPSTGNPHGNTFMHELKPHTMYFFFFLWILRRQNRLLQIKWRSKSPTKTPFLFLSNYITLFSVKMVQITKNLYSIDIHEPFCELKFSKERPGTICHRVRLQFFIKTSRQAGIVPFPFSCHLDR